MDVDYTNVENPMTKEQKAEWLAALRSGDYDQGTGVLKRQAFVLTEKYNFCCLGVANELFHLVSNLQMKDSYLREGFNDVFLPKRIQISLGSRNDSHLNFVEIADFIEHKIPAVDE